MKRTALFILTLLAFAVVLWALAALAGLNRWIEPLRDSAAEPLLGFLVAGFAGALILLSLSKGLARRRAGIRLIETPANENEQWLLETVRALAQRAGITPPQLGVFESAQPNAFSVGPRRNDALIAVSSTLLCCTRRLEIEPVVAHEIAHVANGDMVTLTLLLGVIDTFALTLARALGNIVDRPLTRDEDGRGTAYELTGLLMTRGVGALASSIVLWFSRRRELRADAGGARLTGGDRMIAALERLPSAAAEPLPRSLRALAITDPQATAEWLVFRSHPHLAERIMALRTLA